MWGTAREQEPSLPPLPPIFLVQGSSFVDCPVCGRSVGRAVIDVHVNECVGGEGEKPRARERPPPPPRVSPPPAPSAPSALAEMMRAQKAASRVVVFFAERRGGGDRGGGAWFWHWHDASRPPPGLPPAAWSADMALALPLAGGGVPPPGRAAGPRLTVRLATNAAPAPAGSSLGPPPTRVGASLLKSALQKNVRLGRAGAAAACAAALARLDAGELARRLPVILIEDGCLHPALPHAVWCMCAAGKGYALPRVAVASLVRLAAAAAASPVRDDIDDARPPPPGDALDGLFDAAPPPGAPAAALDPGAALLVRALHARAAYGGMPGDVAMMAKAARVWAHRFAGRAGGPPGRADAKPAPPPGAPPGAAWLAWLADTAASTPPHAATDPGRPLAAADIPLAAVDFHVSPIADDLLRLPPVAAEAAAAAVAAGTDAGDALRRAMWVFRSGRNVRARRVARRAAADVAADAAERDALRPLWRTAAAAADAWSKDFVAGRMR
jgi:hypothetical protein